MATVQTDPLIPETAPPSSTPQSSSKPTTTTSFNIRAPTTFPTTFTPPSLPFLLGTWHVTHSTLPMWRKNRNVKITYETLSTSSSSSTTTDPASAIDPTSTVASPTPKLLDVVTYNPLNSSKLKTVTGVDTPSGNGTAVWDWRGKGWLMIASSHWEVLGYGGSDSSTGDGDGEGEGWAVTYFAKTLFTPAGIDIYSRREEGLGKEVVEGILAALREVDHEGVRGLVGEVFVVASDFYES